MRTLKKSLALVLALVMVLGLGVIGASADNKLDSYTDADTIGEEYLEAVGVLTGLEIVDGMTDTTIEPEGTYNRAQAAKIIAYMVLGKDAADSLVCTVAPFNDVPADFWAAGYISFCVEQGIISGMTESTFEPYGTLTGFQWAKMLLSAVGFNHNGEFEGDSWSLNTARVAHNAGLFDGDLSGADHVNLSRQQAMLYAFNTLTAIRQVTYTANGNNYVYDIEGYDWADGTGYTLGVEVFDLTYVEGEIIDNEGTGANATYVENANYKEHVWPWWNTEEKVVDVKADTDLDLMYHAVRVWYTGSNTGVYVYDLAKVTTYECMHIPAFEDVEDDLDSTKVGKETIGDTNDTAYECYVIDNTALDLLDGDDYNYVTLYADYTKLGYAGTTETTIGSVRVDNDLILTDISDIDYNDAIITVHAEVTPDTPDVVKPNDGEAWYVYAVSSTEGVVDEYNRDDDGVVSVTLTDGTVLEMSTFWDDVHQAEDYYKIGQNYKFVLDTHGDVIYATRDGARDLYYFTGNSREGDDQGDWAQYDEYRFVHVTTGDEFVVPVSNDSALVPGHYYDIRVTPNTNGKYVVTDVDPEMVDEFYAGEYVLDDFVIDANSNSVDIATGEVTDNIVYFELDTIVFKVVEGENNSLSVKTYNGLEELAERFPNAANSTYWFLNACFTVTGTMSGHQYATTVFVDEDAFAVSGSYVFIPEDVTYNKWNRVVSGDDNVYIAYYNGAYVDGVKQSVEVYIDLDDVAGTPDIEDYVMERGFYKWTYNGSTGRYYITGPRLEDGFWCAYENVHWAATDPTDESWEFWYSDAIVPDHVYAYADSVKIVDLTGEWDSDDEPTLSWLYTYATEYRNAVKLAYSVSKVSEDVNVIYVVDKGWRNSGNIVTADDLGYWQTNISYSDLTTDANGNYTFENLPVYYRGAGYVVGEEMYFYFEDSTTPVKGTVVSVENNVARFELEDVTLNIGWTQDKVIEITAVKYKVDFAVAETWETEHIGWSDPDDVYEAPKAMYVDFSAAIGEVTFNRTDTQTGAETRDVVFSVANDVYTEDNKTFADTTTDENKNITVDFGVINHSVTITLIDTLVSD